MVTVGLLIMITVIYPPLMFLTLPVIISMALRAHEKRQAARRALDVDPPHRREDEKARTKALGQW